MLLLASGGMSKLCLSPLYRTSPVDCAPGTPDFVNAALCGFWNRTPEELHSLCLYAEEKAGRPVVHLRNSNRPLDIDIIFFGELIINTTRLKIPHPEARKRLFVMKPLADIAGEFVFPDQPQLNVTSILASLESGGSNEILIQI